MKIIVKKLTDESLMRRACEFTINFQETKMSLYKMYEMEHSPMRTQMFWIEMTDIPTFVSVHFRTHSAGITHFVKSNREDRPGHTGDLGRWQPVNHAMILNAESLINLSKKRLCRKAHEKTVFVMAAIKEAIKMVDKDLPEYMVPNCVYRNKCSEPKPCGYFAKWQLAEVR